MSVQRMVLLVLAASAFLLTPSSLAPLASAQYPAVHSSSPAGQIIPYAGQLTDLASHPVADGSYDFAFSLYTDATSDQLMWNESQAAIPVQAGAFDVQLGSVKPIPDEVLAQGAAWLAVQVRGPGETGYTDLVPRQRVGAPTVGSQSVSAAAGLACPHNHVGETWAAAGTTTGLWITSVNNYGLAAYSTGSVGLVGINAAGSIIFPTGKQGVAGVGDSDGVYGRGAIAGVEGASTAGYGVWGHSTAGNGVMAHSDNSDSLYVDGAGMSGVYVKSAGHNGVEVSSANWTGVYVASSGYDAIRVQTAGQDGLRFFSGMGRDYIRAGDDGDLKFRLDTNGVAHAVMFDTHPDFAELMTTETGAVSYQPGDVLVISTQSDREVALSSESYSALVMGVYSTQPGLVGSPHVMEEQQPGEVPVAVVGIVPVKVSAENGAIRRGDLLVTSSTPGRAMRADNPPPGTILGKALQPLASGTGLIEALIALQ